MTDQTDPPDHADHGGGDEPTTRDAVEAALTARVGRREDGVVPSDTTPVAEAIRARRNRQENR